MTRKTCVLLTFGAPGVCCLASEAFCFWKGDMEAHAKSHRLTRYYLCNSCCDFCMATSDRRSPELSWGALTLRALWRNTLTLSRDPQDRSPWAQIARFEKSKRLLDLLHIVHLGTLRDLVPAVIIDALSDGGLATFYGLEGRPWDEILHKFSHHAGQRPKNGSIHWHAHNGQAWSPQALALADAGVGYSD